MLDWISVKDRLPEELLKGTKRKEIKVLVAIKNKRGWTVRSQLRVLDWFEKNWMWKYSAGEVTHWMPLPKPPKENSP